MATRTAPRRSIKSVLATPLGTLAVALATAAIAAALIIVAINHYRNSVRAANTPTTVLVANHLIEKGTSGVELATAGLYSPIKVTQKHLATGAIANAAALAGKVAVTNILPGQQLTLADFAPASGLATQLAADQRAISVALDPSHGLGGILTAGDHVDVYADFTGPGGPQLRLLVSDVLVLGTTAPGGGIASSGTGNVVLAINDNQAAEVAFAADNGKIWLLLRPGNAQDATRTVATLQSILAGRPASGSGGRP
jgi:Flp pilus assembly protein CpaB